MDQTNTTPETAETPTQFAIVELFGHQRIAGRISHQAVAGVAFFTVHVPDVVVKDSRWVPQPDRGEQLEHFTRTIPAHTRSLGASAIYSINWCDEAAAVVAAYTIRHEPMRAYSLVDAIDKLPAHERARLGLGVTVEVATPKLEGPAEFAALAEVKHGE